MARVGCEAGEKELRRKGGICWIRVKLETRKNASLIGWAVRRSAAEYVAVNQVWAQERGMRVPTSATDSPTFSYNWGQKTFSVHSKSHISKSIHIIN